MGDCLLLTSPVRAVKEEFPGFRISVLVESRFAPCFGSREIRSALSILTGLPSARAKLEARAANDATTVSKNARTGFIHGQGTSLHLLTVQGGNGGGGRGRVAHRNESEAAGAAGDAIIDERHFGDGAVLFEKILEIVLGSIEGKISYVEFHVFEFWSNSLPATSRSRESGFKSPKSETQLTIYQAKKQNRP